MCYYEVRDNSEKGKFDIRFDVKPNDTTIEKPKEVDLLYSDIEETLATLNSLPNAKQEKKQQYFNNLLSLAQAGLGCGEYVAAGIALERLREEMLLVEGRRIKNEYMVELGLSSLTLAILAFMVYEILGVFNLTMFSSYCIVWHVGFVWSTEI